MTNPRRFRQPYTPVHPLTLDNGYVCLGGVKIARFNDSTGVLSFLSHSHRSNSQAQDGPKARVVEIDAREFGARLLRLVEGK